MYVLLLGNLKDIFYDGMNDNKAVWLWCGGKSSKKRRYHQSSNISVKGGQEHV